MNAITLRLPGANEYFMHEAYNVLRTNIQFCGQDVKTIAITSSVSNEGKSVVSLNVGISLAEIGKRVLVIDADMRKSVMMGRNTNAKNVMGLSEVLTGQAQLRDCIVATQFESLHILFAGQYPPNPVELLNSVYFERVIAAAKEAYDYVIVDTPPLGLVIDAAVVSALCDSAIVIVGRKDIRRKQVQEVVTRLKDSGCNVLGVVMNKAGVKNGRRYRGDRYYYYRKK